MTWDEVIATIEATQAEVAELRRQRDEAVKLFRKYGRHSGECKYLDSLYQPPTGTRAPCSCGLDVALGRVEDVLTVQDPGE